MTEAAAERGARAAVLQKVVHFLTAFNVLLKAISKLDQPAGYWPVIIFLLASSAYIVTITLLHDRLHAHERLLTASVYALEAIVTGIVAWLFASEGKQGLPWVFALASLLFTGAFIARLVRR